MLAAVTGGGMVPFGAYPMLHALKYRRACVMSSSPAPRSLMTCPAASGTTLDGGGLMMRSTSRASIEGATLLVVNSWTGHNAAHTGNHMTKTTFGVVGIDTPPAHDNRAVRRRSCGVQCGSTPAHPACATPAKTLASNCRLNLENPEIGTAPLVVNIHPLRPKTGIAASTLRGA